MGSEPRDRREPALTDPQERFARGLAAGLSQTEAARIAGYMGPREAAVRLSRHAGVREAIRKLRTNRIDKLATLSLRELEIIIRDRSISPAVRLNGIKLSLGMAGHTEKPSEDDKSLKDIDVSAMSLAELDAFLLTEKNKRADAAKPVIDQVTPQCEGNPLKDNDISSEARPSVGHALLIEGSFERYPPFPSEGGPATGEDEAPPGVPHP